MPLPKPNEGESREDWISRCMADETMQAEFDSQAERAAVCHQIWDDRKDAGERPITKSYEADLQTDGDEETFVATITTEALDRDNEVVIARGLHLEKYLRNPIVLFGHDAYSFPIGKSLWVKTRGKKVIAKAKPAPTDEGQDLFALVRGGFLKAVSIGFDPLPYDNYGPPEEKEIKKRPELAKARTVFREADLLEWSVVPIPANPEALISAVGKGLVIHGKMAMALELQRLYEQYKPKTVVSVGDIPIAVKTGIKRVPVQVAPKLTKKRAARIVKVELARTMGRVVL